MDIGAAHDHLQGMMAARPILSRRPNSLLGPRPKDIPKAQRVPLVDVDHFGRNGLLRLSERMHQAKNINREANPVGWPKVGLTNVI